MKFLIYKIILLAGITHIIGQEGKENILKVYSAWTTNFEKRSIELTDLITGGPPKDGIPAIINPKFTTLKEASNWLDEKEPVITVSINGISKAYPLQILMFHEIVNDRIGRYPVLVSFCPLCYSGIVFNRTLNGMPINFGVSGLLRNSDMVMYDQLSESFWQQFTGEAIVGDFTGTKLEVIPSQIISLEQFKFNYPDGLVQSRDTGFDRPYGMNPYTNYEDESSKPFLFKGNLDNRLPPNEKIVGIKIQDSSKAYPYSITANKNVINDNFSGKELVIFHIPGTLSSMDAKYIEDSKDVGSTGVFNRSVNDTALTFTYENGNIIDQESRSEWTITGKCISGEFEGKHLEKINHGDYFSFAWFAFRPESIIFK